MIKKPESYYTLLKIDIDKSNMGKVIEILSLHSKIRVCLIQIANIKEKIYHI